MGKLIAFPVGAARATEPAAPRPFLKWAGGKTQLLPVLLPHLPECTTYFEPFLGGGAVFFALAHLGRFKTARISDVNVNLIAAYKTVRNQPHELIECLQRLQDEYASSSNPEAEYYARRAYPTTAMPDIERAMHLIFFNKTGFNGLYRVNKKGFFNVPWGKNPKATIYEPANILACSKALQPAGILCKEHFMAHQTARRGDLVYFDPPYAPVSATSNFTNYAEGGFDQSDQVMLANDFAALASRGVRVVLSNSDTPEVRKLYKNFEIISVRARRAINSKGDKRGSVGEVIVVGGST